MTDAPTTDDLLRQLIAATNAQTAEIRGLRAELRRDRAPDDPWLGALLTALYADREPHWTSSQIIDRADGDRVLFPLVERYLDDHEALGRRLAAHAKAGTRGGDFVLERAGKRGGVAAYVVQFVGGDSGA